MTAGVPVDGTGLREALPADLAAIQAIYAHHVLHGFGTFEETPPLVDEMADRLAAVRARGLPYLVAERDGIVVGYAYAAPFRLRTAYRYTVEDSVYVAPGCEGRGLGARLLAALIERCAAAGLCQMLAIVGDSNNAASIRVHEKLGFRAAGILTGVGFKRGRWLDIVILQRALGARDAGKP